MAASRIHVHRLVSLYVRMRKEICELLLEMSCHGDFRPDFLLRPDRLALAKEPAGVIQLLVIKERPLHFHAQLVRYVRGIISGYFVAVKLELRRRGACSDDDRQ